MTVAIVMETETWIDLAIEIQIFHAVQQEGGASSPTHFAAPSDNQNFNAAS